MSTTIEQIKERLAISDVLASYMTLQKAGANFKAKCPFHNEKTPSFFISPERNSYYCFGCGVKGDIFTFVQEFEGLDFVGALKVLAERAGVPLTNNIPKEKSEKDVIFRALDEATIFFQRNLADSKESLIYLKKRGLSIEMVREWKIGFALDEWRSLKTHLLSRGFSEDNLLKAGLIKRGDQGTYDRFRGRIMFPLFDSSGRVIAFSGRILKEKEGDAKYLNSPETEVFSKSKVLYGMQKAKYAIKEKRFAILVEGQMDLLMSHQAGFANTVASSGTALTEEHIGIIKRLTDTLVMGYDSDSAGQNASFKAWQIALASGLEVKIASLPQGFDPAQAVLENPSLWKDSVEQSKHIVDYYIEVSKKIGGKESDDIIKEKILPLIRVIESSIDQSRFVRKLSFESSLSEKAIWEELSKIEVLKVDEISQNQNKKNNEKTLNTKKAISFLLYLENKKIPEAEIFKKKLESILPDYLSFIPKDKEEENTLIFEAEMHYGNSPNDQSINEILYYLEEDILKEKFSEVMAELKRGEIDKDIEKINKNATLADKISKEIGNLNKKYFIS